MPGHDTPENVCKLIYAHDERKKVLKNLHTMNISSRLRKNSCFLLLLGVNKYN